MKSYILVGVQFATVVVLFLTGPVIPTNFASLILISTGLLLGLWSILTMRKSKLQVLPDVHSEAKLITTGPYRYIRHPMYACLILVSIGFLFNHFNLLRFVIFLVFLVDIDFKLKYEEKLLERHFGEYKIYKKKTRRIIPFVY